MDTLSLLLAHLSPRCEVNLHCQYGGRWRVHHPDPTDRGIPWHAILRGSGQLTVHGNTWQVNQGDVILLPHGAPHGIESLVNWGHVLPVSERSNGTLTLARTASREHELEMLCGTFYFNHHHDWLFPADEAAIILPAPGQPASAELEALLAMLVSESLGQRPGGELLVQRLADAFLILLFRTLLKTEVPPAGLLSLLRDPRLAPAVHAVLADPAQGWTLESMARRCFVSRATFARHFMRIGHLSPQSWLTQLRMAMAARLLLSQRQMTIETIAAQCGFQSLASFSRAFKQTYADSPGAWRKKHPQP